VCEPIFKICLLYFRKRLNAWHTKFAFTNSAGPAKILDQEESNFANKVNEETKKLRASLKDVIELKYGENYNFPGASNGIEIRYLVNVFPQNFIRNHTVIG
jgi:hypothetical protein